MALFDALNGVDFPIIAFANLATPFQVTPTLRGVILQGRLALTPSLNGFLSNLHFAAQMFAHYSGS